jgi:hypothetical protein
MQPAPREAADKERFLLKDLSRFVVRGGLEYDDSRASAVRVLCAARE